MTMSVSASPRVVEHDPKWAVMFDDEAEMLKVALASATPRIEHVGSTAVPGLSAKPVIDILVGVAGYEQFDQLQNALADVGYVWDADAERDEPGRKVFRKGAADMTELRSHHLHLTVTDGPYWRRLLTFRDQLRRDPAAAHRYAQVKLDLIESCGGDSRAYTQGKTAIVRCIEDQAGFTS